MRPARPVCTGRRELALLPYLRLPFPFPVPLIFPAPPPHAPSFHRTWPRFLHAAAEFRVGLRCSYKGHTQLISMLSTVDRVDFDKQDAYGALNLLRCPPPPPALPPPLRCAAASASSVFFCFLG